MPHHLVQLKVFVEKRRPAPELHPRWLREVLRAAFATAAGPGSVAVAPALSVRILGALAMRRLNRQFTGEDHATDVLSFPSESSGDPTGRDYLGDIALCWPLTVAQAAEYGHPVPTEAALLCVHGLLHLLGHDHHTPRAQARMWALTHRCLAAAGIPDLGAGRLPARPKMGRS